MFGTAAKAVLARLITRALPSAIAASRQFPIFVIDLKDVSIFLVLVSLGINYPGGHDCSARELCGWVVVQLMHFCFQIGRDSDRSPLAVKSKIQIFSKVRRKGLPLGAVF
jgi:hypothetical protein